MRPRLERSTTNKVVAGVCGGIAEYLQVDPTLVRVLFVIGSVLSGGLGVLGYIALVLFMPLPGQPAPFVKPSVSTPPTDSGAAAGDDRPAVAPPASDDPEATERRRAAFGFFLIALGAIFLFSNAGVFRVVRWDLVWPLVFIAAGGLLLAQRMRR